MAAEPLSPAKREKLERMWGAQVFDQFGMTEGALVSCESVERDGLHLWSDLFFVEIVDETTGLPVAEGEAGSLVITPLYINNVTPFLRWVSGDVISMKPQGNGDLRLVDLPGHAARASHRRLLQGARDQPQSFRARRFDVPQSGRDRFQGGSVRLRRRPRRAVVCSSR